MYSTSDIDNEKKNKGGKKDRECFLVDYNFK